ncbi:MAG: CehA/McbA family metallohydrolase, partial [Janthinobacterium lividum]
MHAAGCSHYESPTEGVTPEVMARQVAGEALDLGSVLNWGPGFAYQRRFFSGHTLAPEIHHDHAMVGAEVLPASLPGSGLLRYDVEVSGFPSSHCGHLVLLRLKNDTYPGSSSTQDWPSWNLPILRWAKSQGALTGYAHVGHGLVTEMTALPNYVMPPFNSSGANEFLVDITHPGIIDFLSGCDLWPFAELNVWYHTLNCGFRSAFAGETDFPCITDECVGGGRSYARLPNGPPAGDEGYSAWLQALVSGDAYFGDGRSHIIDMQMSSAGAKATGDGIGRTLALHEAQKITVTAQVCARLEAEPDQR